MILLEGSEESVSDFHLLAVTVVLARTEIDTNFLASVHSVSFEIVGDIGRI